MRRFKVVVFGVLIFFSVLIRGQGNMQGAAQSDLDPTFGNAGTVIWSPDNNTTSRAGTAMALQADGKIVMTGGFSETSGVTDFMAVRFNANGSLDTTFGTAGVVIITFGGAVETANSIDIQPDGKIVMGGRTSLSGGGYEFAIARLNTDGSLDTTFSEDGKVAVGFTINGSPTSDQAYALRVMPSGKIVIGGGSGPGPNLLYYRTMARLNADGSLDASFGNGGRIIDGLGTGFWRDIVANPDGTMYVGSDASAQFSSSIAIRKFSETGSTLWNWGQFNQPGCYMTLNALATQPDGKILAAGSLDCRASVLRIDSNGVTDTTFNYGEIQNSASAKAVVVQPDGKVVASITFQSPSDGFSLVRYNPNGSLDTTFGTGGVKRTTVWNGSESAADLVIQPDGKFILGGGAGSTSTTNYRFAMARYLGLSVRRPTPFDFDGDGRADITVYRPSNNVWYQLLGSNYQFSFTYFGASGDILTPADYDGDGKTDISIFRPSSGIWVYASCASGGTQLVATWGQAGDIPLPSDFNGDGKADFIVYRPSTNFWYRLANGTNAMSFVNFGAVNDKPVIGDFDGDGKSDPAVFRPSTGEWFYASSLNSGQHLRAAQWGLSTDQLVPADYDGDGKTDPAIYRNGLWAIYNSGNGSFTILTFGLASDKPVAADYDGDGKADVAVFRPSDGTWYMLRSTSGFQAITFGASTDIPIPSAFVQ